jgi:hypothetical protein
MEAPSLAAIVEPPLLVAIVEVTAATVEVTAAIVEAITAADMVEVTGLITAAGDSSPVQPSELSPALRRQAPIIRTARRPIAAMTPIHLVSAGDEAPMIS